MEETEDEKAIREDILLAVEKLGAFMPDPNTDVLFFKFMLKKLQQGAPENEKW